MSNDIHATAIVDPNVRLGDGVRIGPYAVIGAGVEIGAGTVIDEHASIRGPLIMGRDCRVGPSAVVGHDPQVVGKDGPFGRLRIGDRCTLREFSQIHRSMYPDRETVVGNDVFLMATAHIAHDCIVGNDVVICNGSLIAGHVTLGDHAFLAGGASLHQFVRVGRYAMCGGLVGAPQDVPPYCTIAGARPARLEGLNVVGLRRAGISREGRRALKEAYRILFRSDLPLAERLAAADRSTAEVAELCEFIEASERGVTGFGGRSQSN